MRGALSHAVAQALRGKVADGGDVTRKVLSAAHCFADRDPSHYRIAEGSDLMSLDLAERRKTARVTDVSGACPE